MFRLVPSWQRLLPALAACALAGSAYAEIPRLDVLASANCVRSATLLHCDDGHGGYYGMALQGNDIFLRGHDGVTGLSWAQTSTSLGRVQLLGGISSDGNIWYGVSRSFGWNVISRISSSSGERSRVTCNRVKGCD